MLLIMAVVLLLSLAPACQVAVNGVVAAPAGYSTGQPQLPLARQATETTENKVVGALRRPITAADNVRLLCDCIHVFLPLNVL